MSEMAKFPYLTGRRGTSNLYYKRLVPLELHAPGRPGQMWRSLRTSDRKAVQGCRFLPLRLFLERWMCCCAVGLTTLVYLFPISFR